MKIVILFDSFFGNTQRVAEQVLSEISKCNKAEIYKIEEAPENIEGLFDVFIIGSPTRAFNPSENTLNFLKKLNPTGKKFAFFDTHISQEDIPVKLIKYIQKKRGTASETMAKKVEKKEGKVIAKPLGIWVQDSKGPIKEGETPKIVAWSTGISFTLKQSFLD